MARRKYSKSKSNSSPSKSEDKVESKETIEASGGQETSPEKGRNDMEWYSRDPRLLLDGANIPYNIPFGAELKYIDGVTMPVPGGHAISSNLVSTSVAGICTLRLKPSVGYNALKTDPLNVCANAFYTHVRYMNSGRKNYDPSDLMIYALTFGDLYSFLIWCERLYCYAFMYSQRNWYIGRNLIKANGVDPDNIIQNLANFRYWINSMINKISSFCLPGDIYFFKRRAFLYQNYYIENGYGNIKDQLYQLAPEGFYKFELAHGSGAGTLRYTPLDFSNPLKVSDLISYFDSLMTDITGDEDFGLMSGDVRKAYGDVIIGLTQLGEDATLTPVFDPYVLAQIKNATILGAIYRGDPSKTYTVGTESYVYGDVEQTVDGLLLSREGLDWSLSKYAYYMAAKKLLSVENPDPNIGDTMEGTRLMASLRDGDVNCGTEIAVNLEITWLRDLVGNEYQSISETNTLFTIHEDLSQHTLNQLIDWIRYFKRTGEFKYCPFQWLLYLDSANFLEEITQMGNVDNGTLLTNDMVNRIHEIALLSLFYVPGVAKLIS